MARPMIKTAGGLEQAANAGYGNTDNPGIDSGRLATVGAGVLTNALLAGHMVYRTGSTAAFTDTIDTVANIDAGIGMEMGPGDNRVIDYSNQIAFIATIAGVTGITLRSTKTTIAASALGKLLLQKVANAIYSYAPNTSGQMVATVVTPGVYNLFVL